MGHFLLEFLVAVALLSAKTVAVYSEDCACEFEGLRDHFSWLGIPLNVTFSSLRTCNTFALSRNGMGTDIDSVYVEVGNRKIVTFSIPMVTEDYKNATMTVQGQVDDSKLVCYKNFTLFTQDTVGPVIGMNYSTNCTSTTVHWQPPVTLGQLNVSCYYYQLIRNQSMVYMMGTTTDTFVSFNTSTLRPNVPGYSVLVLAHAPPGNGTSMNLSVAATEDPRVVEFSYDVIFETNGTCTVTLKLIVNESCFLTHPTKGFISIVMGSGRPVNRSFPISFDSNGTDVVHIDSLEVGHADCRAVVVIENLSGGTLVDNFTFSTAVNSTQSISPTLTLTLTPTPTQTPRNNPGGLPFWIWIIVGVGGGVALLLIVAMIFLLVVCCKLRLHRGGHNFGYPVPVSPSEPTAENTTQESTFTEEEEQPVPAPQTVGTDGVESPLESGAASVAPKATLSHPIKETAQNSNTGGSSCPLLDKEHRGLKVSSYGSMPQSGQQEQFAYLTDEMVQSDSEDRSELASGQFPLASQ